jgi:surface antigen Omp85-like protein/WD40 repeat protein
MQVTTTTLRRGAFCAVAATLALTSPADAQYFGRNKVQYETFDFRVMATNHFDILFYPAESLVTSDAARMAERWYARLSGEMRHTFDRKPIIFYADHPDFEQTNIIGGFIDQSTGGVTEGLRDRVVIPFTGVYRDNDHVIGHELVHVFQYDIDAKQRTGNARVAGINSLPLWLIEGMAEYLSLGRQDANTAMWLRDAALRNDLPSIRQLTTDPRYFPYRYGQALWAYIGGKWGDQAVNEVYRASIAGGWEAAIHRVLGISSDSLSKEWLATIRFYYLPFTEGRAKPKETGQVVLGQEHPGDFNLSPTLSPDGRYVAFLSRRGIFTIDLYIADAQTGRIVKRLTSPNTDTHFDAISFIQSSGSWSPDGKKLAFIVFANGDNELAIFDVDRGKVERQLNVKGIGSITDPAWSPDGRRIAFSGLVGGVADLFTLDVEGGTVARLTNDRYADLQPTWSPDGKTIAYVTDRGDGTDLSTLRYGPMRLATLDVASGTVQLVPTLDGAKQITPQYSADGKSLYFVSDRGGFSDVYRTEIATGAVFQVTRVATGVSGITNLSPAITIARQTGRMLFSVFDDAGYNVVGLEAAQMQGAPIGPIPATVAAAGLLPPVSAAGVSQVEAYLADATTGLIPAGQYTVRKYRSNLSLEYLGTPGLGVGVSTFGTGLVGGVAAYFGDLLSNRTVGTTLQATGTVKDFGGELFYLSSKRRLNWLAGVSHVPYLGAQTFIKDTVLNIGGQPTQGGIISQQLQRVFVDQASLTAQYPVSQTKRFEIGGSYNLLYWNIENQDLLVVGNTVVGERRGSIPAPPGFNYGQVTAAFVGDYSYFGFTSPVAGGRYRLEVSPAFGGLNMETVVADYRRYLFVRPVTLAFRALHYGRYGKDSEDPTKLSPIYVGQEPLVRGYSVENFEPRECSAVGGNVNSCPEFDRLVGSRIGVANIELRIPLFGTEQFGIFRVPFLPTEISPFLDAGVAWSKDSTASFKFARNTTERVPVFSTGLSARFNLFGYAVVEAYYAYPFQRPSKGWHFGFQLAPGW